jgi:hypothetical protein
MHFPVSTLYSRVRIQLEARMHISPFLLFFCCVKQKKSALSESWPNGTDRPSFIPVYSFTIIQQGHYVL